MGIFAWEQDLCIGINSIDDQHRKLISLINDFLEAALNQRALDQAGHLLTGLQDYVTHHFKTEESYFDLFDYSEKESHIREHRWFEEQVHALRDMMMESDPGFSARAIKLLKTWFINHVKQTDMKYAPFFRRKGLT